jgi:hypothetical protein
VIGAFSLVACQLLLMVFQHQLYQIKPWLFELLSVLLLALWGSGLVAASVSTWK